MFNRGEKLQSPLMVQVMHRGRGRLIRLGKTAETRKSASVIRRKRKLRLLDPWNITFIRGPRDRSLWREEGRHRLLSAKEQVHRTSWREPDFLLGDPNKVQSWNRP
ncbi:hypothetical protein [Paludifilum halophilum]|uniref:Uncharacterized protein n=1 Tax=Paludifilum halophilum TaxID=1642702 RepID=A0A235BBZ2_9BACL|nr:hypothetical protein [Paludifilum halophilum]OYD09796.1 hypothetical protein CHM34_02030 [Paludifilum halophilum]